MSKTKTPLKPAERRRADADLLGLAARPAKPNRTVRREAALTSKRGGKGK